MSFDTSSIVQYQNTCFANLCFPYFQICLLRDEYAIIGTLKIYF